MVRGVEQTIKCWIIDLSRSNVPIDWAFSERSFASDFSIFTTEAILYAKLSWQNDCRLGEAGASRAERMRV